MDITKINGTHELEPCQWAPALTPALTVIVILFGRVPLLDLSFDFSAHKATSRSQGKIAQSPKEPFGI